LVDELNLGECAIFAWDARGHGRSPGVRGDAPSFGALVRDLDCFARHIADAHGIPLERMALVGSSLGAVIASAWVHDYAPPLRGLVLAAPAFSREALCALRHSAAAAAGRACAGGRFCAATSAGAG